MDFDDRHEVEGMLAWASLLSDRNAAMITKLTCSVELTILPEGFTGILKVCLNMKDYEHLFSTSWQDSKVGRNLQYAYGPDDADWLRQGIQEDLDWMLQCSLRKGGQRLLTSHALCGLISFLEKMRDRYS